MLVQVLAALLFHSMDSFWISFSVHVQHSISGCYPECVLSLGTDSLSSCPTSLPFPSSSSVHFLLLIWSTSCSLCFDAGLISKAVTQPNAAVISCM